MLHLIPLLDLDRLSRSVLIISVCSNQQTGRGIARHVCNANDRTAAPNAAEVCLRDCIGIDDDVVRVGYQLSASQAT